MLVLDMQIQTALTCISLVALRIGAPQVSLDFDGLPTVVLFAAALVPLARLLVQVLLIIVELLDLNDAAKEGVTL